MSKILDLPEQSISGWLRYYADEPWDMPSQAILGWVRRKEGHRISGDDAAGLEEAFARRFGG